MPQTALCLHCTVRWMPNPAPTVMQRLHAQPPDMHAPLPSTHLPVLQAGMEAASSSLTAPCPHVQVPGMTAIQVLRTILQQLGQPSALAGNDSSYMCSAPASQSSENAADGALKPTPATKAAFKAQYHAVLVEPSGRLNLAATVSASGLQQVSLWLLECCCM